MNNRGRFDMSTPWWFREEGPDSTSPEPGPGAEDEEVPCRCTDALADAACRTHGVLAFLSGLGNPGPTTKDPPTAHSAAGKPKQPRRTDKWRTVAAELRARPGEWAVLLEAERFGNGGGIAGQIKAGDLAAFRPAGSFDATTRTVDGLYAVYARYIGEDS